MAKYKPPGPPDILSLDGTSHLDQASRQSVGMLGDSDAIKLLTSDMDIFGVDCNMSAEERETGRQDGVELQRVSIAGELHIVHEDPNQSYSAHLEDSSCRSPLVTRALDAASTHALKVLHDFPSAPAGKPQSIPYKGKGENGFFPLRDFLQCSARDLNVSDGKEATLPVSHGSHTSAWGSKMSAENPPADSLGGGLNGCVGRENLVLMQDSLKNVHQNAQKHTTIQNFGPMQGSQNASLLQREGAAQILDVCAGGDFKNVSNDTVEFPSSLVLRTTSDKHAKDMDVLSVRVCVRASACVHVACVYVCPSVRSLGMRVQCLRLYLGLHFCVVHVLLVHWICSWRPLISLAMSQAWSIELPVSTALK